MKPLITNVAIIADKYLANGYRLAGVAPFPVKTLAEARARLRELTAKGGHKVIILPEEIAYQLREERKELVETAGLKTLFIIVPNFRGPTGERTRELHQTISKAVGAKLKFEE